MEMLPWLPSSTWYVLPGCGPAHSLPVEAWPASLGNTRARKSPFFLKFLATQKRNSGENFPATASGTRGVADSVWSFSAYILLFTSLNPHPLSSILQSASCNLLLAT